MRWLCEWASLGGGSMDLGCTDLIVSGNYDLGGGTLTGVRHVTVNSGGSLSFGAGGSIALAGNWANSGTITATGGTDGIDSNGNIVINGGDIHLTSRRPSGGNRALDASGSITINGGTVTTNDGSENRGARGW